MTKAQTKIRIRTLREFATDAARNVTLNPKNAAIWKAEVIKFRALAAALEVDMQIAAAISAR